MLKRYNSTECIINRRHLRIAEKWRGYESVNWPVLGAVCGDPVVAMVCLLARACLRQA